MSQLQLESIRKVYQDGEQELIILDEVNFQTRSKKLIGIVGPSGSGKSTLLSIAGALLTPSSGEVYLNQQPLSELSEKELTQVRLEQIGFIFQGGNLISYLTVLDQLRVIGRLSGQATDQIDRQARELLSHLGLSDRLTAYPKMLSGGQKQRVAIARAFMNDPSVILADEPTGNLDEERGRQVVEMIRDEIHHRGKEGIIVTHDERLLALVDEVYELKDKQLIKQ